MFFTVKCVYAYMCVCVCVCVCLLMLSNKNYRCGEKTLNLNDYCYCFERRIYLNLSKSTQSAAGLKVLNHDANGRYLLCKSLPYYFQLLYRSTFIL